MASSNVAVAGLIAEKGISLSFYWYTLVESCGMVILFLAFSRLLQMRHPPMQSLWFHASSIYKQENRQQQPHSNDNV